MTPDLPILRGDRVLLRRPIADDVQKRLALERHRQIVEGYGGIFNPDATYTPSDAEAAIRFIADQPYAWVIDAGRFIGHVRFHGFEPQDKRAAFAIGIDNPAYLGRGYGTEAAKLALAYTFSTGLHRVSLRVLATNARAIASYRKCGFKEEGREREAALVYGHWIDDITMGLLDREFVADPS